LIYISLLSLASLIIYTEDPTKWSIEEVYRWATKIVGLSVKSASILRDNQVDGDVLLTLTKEELLKILPLGPATQLPRAIKELKAKIGNL
jgi:hypothetical protein